MAIHTDSPPLPVLMKRPRQEYLSSAALPEKRVVHQFGGDDAAATVVSGHLPALIALDDADATRVARAQQRLEPSTAEQNLAKPPKSVQSSAIRKVNSKWPRRGGSELAPPLGCR
jgi:hypothetical protein